jgi:hypothetical protein
MVSGVYAGRILLGAAAVLVTVSQFALAQTSGYSTTYEPSSRQRLRSEACMKDEVEQGAYCVKRCDEDFKLEVNGKKALCRATKSGATRKPPQVEYQPPPPVPNAPPSKSGY